MVSIVMVVTATVSLYTPVAPAGAASSCVSKLSGDPAGTIFVVAALETATLSLSHTDAADSAADFSVSVDFDVDFETGAAVHVAVSQKFPSCLIHCGSLHAAAKHYKSQSGVVAAHVAAQLSQCVCVWIPLGFSAVADLASLFLPFALH